MPVLRHINQLATCPPDGDQGYIGCIESAALVWRGSQICWLGPEKAVPEEYAGEEPFDARGRLVIPGLVDCHTHLCFGGWRADEFCASLEGASYQEIAAAGGGIFRTVEATRAASTEALLERAHHFLREMLRLGVVAVECKSGYGLDRETELKQLRIYRALNEQTPMELIPTYLGAHVRPRGHKDYLSFVCKEMIPLVAKEGLAFACDVFIEEGAFSAEEGRQVLEAAAKAGLERRVHADQFSDASGALIAAAAGALSADHLECASDEGVDALARSRAVAVSLPLAAFYLGQRPLDARRLISKGIPVAVATDFNPGSAPSYHLPLAMLLACRMQGMTPAQALKGATAYAARSLGRSESLGSLGVGRPATFAVIDAATVDEWLYHFCPNRCLETFIEGVPTHGLT